MTNQVNETLKIGEEGFLSFDFDEWIKIAFVEKDMVTLNTLTMDNTNFVSIMSDYRILQNMNLKCHTNTNSLKITLSPIP